MLSSVAPLNPFGLPASRFLRRTTKGSERTQSCLEQVDSDYSELHCCFFRPFVCLEHKDIDTH